VTHPSTHPSNLTCYLEALNRNEGCVPWPYCDKGGNVTIGIGELIRDSSALVALPLVRMSDERPASPEEKVVAFNRVRDFFTPGLTATAYRALTIIRLPQSEAMGLCVRRLEEDFIPSLWKMFPDFEAWPLDASVAVVDMAYNLGVKKLLTEYPSFLEACREHDWRVAARECIRRSGVRSKTDIGPRNEWTVRLLNRAGGM
jgi:GH24 family phage-related lysozyme (muramidase)